MALFDEISAQLLRINEGQNRIQAANNRIGASLLQIQNNPPSGGLTQAEAQQILAAVTLEGDAALMIAGQVEANAALAEQIAGT